MNADIIAERLEAPRVQAIILCALAQRRGWWLSGKALAYQLYGDPFATAARTHLWRIRKRWGAGIVESHRRFGYRLSAEGLALVRGAG